MNKDIQQGKLVIEKFIDEVLPVLHLTFPLLSEQELRDSVRYSCIKRMKNGKAVLENNYSKKVIDTTVIEMTEYIMSKEPIITTQGVMFKKHGTVPNPLYELIQEFIDKRIEYKKEMFKYPKGSEQFAKYNLLQLLAKLDANATYGAMGMYSCVLYNIFVASSITAQGRSCISAAILLMEGFLSNNVKFGSLNEIVQYIKNVITENRKYKDSDILDGNVTLEESFFKIMSTCGFEYIPTDKDMQIVWDMMSQLGQEDLNRLFYKNNLYSFMDNSSMRRAVIYILQKLDRPFMDPNKPPKCIQIELEAFYQILYEYVYYGHQYIDRLERTENMIRNVSIITDTDSTIISLDAWYRYTLAYTYNVPMEIKRIITDPFIHMDLDEWGDEKIPFKPFEHIEPRYDYDFYTDEVIELERVINPFKICPQEGLKYSIINIMSHIIGKLCVDYMMRYSMNSHSYADSRKCLLILKNEFYFERVLNTDAKKNYADIQKLQEGNEVPEDSALDVKGLPITKSTLPKRTVKGLKRILKEKILTAENINQIDVLKAIKIMKHEIYQSLLDGSKEYYMPVKIRSRSGYDNPMRIYGFKAAYAYNALRLDGMDPINLDNRNSIDLMKVNINMSNIEHLKEEMPELYDKLVALLSEPEFDGELKMIAIPLNEPVPEWSRQFIDFNTIINNNIANFPLESIGLFRNNKSSVNSTNILKI